MLIFVAILAAPSVWKAIRFDRSAPENLAYYDVPAQMRLTYGLADLALAAYLAVMTGEVHKMLESAGVRGRL
jgi:hypothetical protein